MSDQTDDLREPLVDDDRRDQAEDDALPPPPSERPAEVDDLEMDDEYHRGHLVDADPELEA